MLRQLSDLETVLRQLVAEHRKLLGQVEAQQAAMRAMDLVAMDDAGRAQETCRLRIAALETRRKGLVLILTRGMKADPAGAPFTLTKLAELYPSRRDALLEQRDELKAVVAAIASRTKVASRVAAAVLGHLNTVVTALAGVVERAGTYTKYGVPRVASRIGTLEAIA